jgi:hypothetical protein
LALLAPGETNDALRQIVQPKDFFIRILGPFFALRFVLLPVPLLAPSAVGIGGSGLFENQTHQNKKEEDIWRREDLFGQTLIDQTLQELKEDVDFQETAARLKKLGAEQVTKEERALRRRALDSSGIPSFAKFMQEKNVVHSTLRAFPVLPNSCKKRI